MTSKIYLALMAASVVVLSFCFSGIVFIPGLFQLIFVFLGVFSGFISPSSRFINIAISSAAGFIVSVVCVVVFVKFNHAGDGYLLYPLLVINFIFFYSGVFVYFWLAGRLSNSKNMGLD